MVRGKYSKISRLIFPRRGHNGGQSTDEIQRLKLNLCLTGEVWLP
jgi:hypothetical protein